MMNRMSNDEVLEKFEEDCLLRDMSDRSRESYLRIFGMLVAFSGVEEYESLDEACLRRWLLHLKKEEKLSSATINQYNSACKFFLKTVLEKDIDDRQVPNSRLRRKPQPAMTADETRDFFSRFNDITSFTYFMLLYSTGIRRSEALGITPADIKAGKTREDACYLIVRNGKGGHTRNVELPYATYMLLREYYRIKWNPIISEMSEKDKEGISTTLLFPPSINGIKANSFFPKAFNAIRKSSIKFREYHPHTLRHSFAVHMLQKDINNILRVQANLGHKSLATTEIYLRDAKLYGIKDALSPQELAKELCDAFYARAGI